jgi:hypothetical protein
MLLRVLAMKPRVALAIMVLASLVGNGAAQADSWSLMKLFTVEYKPKPKPTPKPAKKGPSTLTKMGADTKRFFGNVGKVLTGKKPSAANSTSQLASASKPKKSVSSWNPFRKKEPKPPESLKDSVEMQRSDP